MFKELKNLTNDNDSIKEEKNNEPSDNMKRLMKETFQSVMEGSMYFLYGNYNCYCRINNLQKENDDTFLACMEDIRGKDNLEEFLLENINKNNVYEFFHWYMFKK